MSSARQQLWFVDARTKSEHPYGMTRGDLLTHSISYALIRAKKIVRGLSYGLTEDERWAVAKATVDELRRHGDQWKLDEELPQQTGQVHSTPERY
jgi:hypothetical protein